MHPADEGCESPTTPDTRTLRAAILTAHDSRRGSDDSRTGRIVRNDGEQYSHEAPRLEEQAEAAGTVAYELLVSVGSRVPREPSSDE